MRAFIEKYRFELSNDGSACSISDLDGDPDLNRITLAATLAFDDVKARSAVALVYPGAVGWNNKVYLAPENAQQLRQQLLLDAASIIDDLVLTTDPQLGRDLLRVQTLTATRILGALAVSGLETAFPSVPMLPEAELRRIRESYAAERLAYLDGLRHHIRQAREAISAGEFESAWEYAKMETTPKLRVLTVAYERAIEHAALPFWDRVKDKVVDAMPQIGSKIAFAIAASTFSKEMGAAVLASVFTPVYAAAAAQLKSMRWPPTPPDDIAFVVRVREEVMRR